LKGKKKMTAEETIKWSLANTAKEAVDILHKHRYDAVYADTVEQARDLVLGLISKGSSVALGGSVTLDRIHMVETFREGDYRFYDRYQKLPFAETVEIMRQSMTADFLVTSVNAITRNGELVCLDCTGNRAAGMLFGPRRVIVVAGANKVVDTIDEAIKRTKEIAPLNVKRLGHKAPCVETGRCSDCDVPGRMCNGLSVIRYGGKFPGRFTIIMVGESAGY
jgi:hypothetical protein